MAKRRAVPQGEREGPLEAGGQPSRLMRALAFSQRPKEWGRAVSRTILVLAVVTIALGVAVLALARQLDLNRVEDAPPGLAMDADGPAGTAQVLRADVGLSWADLEIHGDCVPLLNGVPLIEHPLDPVRAGDVVTCQSGSNLQVASPQADGGALLFEATFG